MPWQTVTVFLTLPHRTRNPEFDRFSVLVRFGTNRYTFEQFPPLSRRSDTL